MTTTIRIIDALVTQAIDYSTAEDKAFMAKDLKAEGVAHGGYQATIKALALTMGGTEADAVERVMEAQEALEARQ